MTHVDFKFDKLTHAVIMCAIDLSIYYYHHDIVKIFIDGYRVSYVREKVGPIDRIESTLWLPSQEDDGLGKQQQSCHHIRNESCTC